MVVQYLLVALVAFIASMDEQLFGITMLGRPLFTSLFVGLILGDVQQGVIVGAALESMFMGAIMVGAAVPPEVYASGVLGCAFAVITGTGTATAVALALPVSVFLQVWRNFCYAVPGAFACKKIETALANRDLAKANLYHLTIVPLSIGIPSALLVFGSLFFGADLINNALNAIPQFVMDGLNVASGVMVCIGFALLIRTMGDNKLLPWLFLGFIMVIYLKMDVVGVAAAAICVALLLAFREGSSGPQAAADKNFDTSSINAMKVGLMGPLSGIGDSFYWGTFRVVAAGIGIGIASTGNPLGPIVYALIYSVINFATRIVAAHLGYDLGTKFLQQSEENNLMSRMTHAAGVLGMTVIGAMIAAQVSLSTALTFDVGGSEIVLQDLFDSIFPGLLPLLATFACVALYKKGVKTIWIIIGIFAICIIGTGLGVFAAA